MSLVEMNIKSYYIVENIVLRVKQKIQIQLKKKKKRARSTTQNCYLCAPKLREDHKSCVTPENSGRAAVSS